MNKIREKRENAGLTIKELAGMIDVHFTTISEWELEKTIPRPKKRIELAEVLNCSKEELLPDLYPQKEKILRATHGDSNKPLKIHNTKIQCYVLEDGTSVLAGRGMQRALGLSQSHGSQWRQLLNQKAVKPYINKDLTMALNTPIRFVRPGRGGKLAVGYEATILIDICDAILQARQENKLKTKKQVLVAKQCEILARAFAKTGIIALIHEVTGYQEIRDKLALQEILNKYIAKELQPYIKTFPLEFYKGIYRLKGWKYPPIKGWKPVVGHFTNDLVYMRLAPRVLEELKKINPKNEKGHRKAKLFQGLTQDIGHPKLKEHIIKVVALIDASVSWQGMKRLIDRALPKFDGRMKQLDFKFEENNDKQNQIKTRHKQI